MGTYFSTCIKNVFNEIRTSLHIFYTEYFVFYSNNLRSSGFITYFQNLQLGVFVCFPIRKSKMENKNVLKIVSKIC